MLTPLFYSRMETINRTDPTAIEKGAEQTDAFDESEAFECLLVWVRLSGDGMVLLLDRGIASASPGDGPMLGTVEN